VERIASQWNGIRWEIDEREKPHEASYLKLDSSRAAARLGWHPRWDLEATLRSIVRWHQAHLEGADMRAMVLKQIDEFNSTQPAAAAAQP